MRAVASYELLDTAPEKDFDDITQLAVDLLEAPIAAVTIVDEHRQWFKSAVGLAVRETSRDISFCTHTIQYDTPFIVNDALLDARFEQNPLVLGEPHIRFYAGIPLINPEGIALGSFCLIDRKPRRLSAEQIELLKALARHVMALFELRLQRNRLRHSLHERDAIGRQLGEYAAHLAEAQRIARVGSWRLCMDEDRLSWSEQVYRIFGLPPTADGVALEVFFSYVHPDDRAALQAAHERMLAGGQAVDIEHRIVRPDGEIRYVHELAEMRLEQPGNRRVLCGTVQDISERKQAELELLRLNRALQMLTACREALVRGADEMQLLEEVCRLALSIGGYKMAWVGYAEDDSLKSITPQAYAGHRRSEEYLGLLKLSWSADSSTGNGPAGRAIRHGEPVIVEDIRDDPAFSLPLAAQAQGYRGTICLPLRDKARVFGLLALYTDEVRHIPTEEISLLRQLADDLAFGICNLRAVDEQKKLQSAVLQVSTSVAASAGQAFFDNLALSMAEVLEAQGSFVARLLPGKPVQAHTIAAAVNGRVARNFDYLLAHTPCANLVDGEDWVVCNGAAERYPDSPLLAKLGSEAYAGTRLVNSSGQAIGMLFVLFAQPLKHAEFVISTLRVFATRAAAELERQEDHKRISEQASLLDKAQDAIIVRDIEGRIQFWNKSAERLYGWTAQEALGRNLEELLDAADFYREATRNVLTLGEWVGEATERRKDGSSVVVEGHWTLVKDDHGRPQAILAIKTDITQRKSAESAIQRLAFFDVLTGLPNRQLLVDRLDKALAHSARSKQGGALLFIDLDNFKTLNDTLGHDIGDLLLQQVAQRLLSCVRRSDSVGRLGGDEFVVMLDNLGEDMVGAAAAARQVGDKVLAAFVAPFSLQDYEYHTTPSIGVTLFNADVADVDVLLKRADLAMYQAKAAGKNTLRFFDPEMQAVVSARANMEANLRQAVRQQQFLLYCQPQVDGDSRITGVELLLRWRHPTQGLVPPLDFIPLAEETGIIIPIGCWVLRQACEQLAQWAAKPRLAHLSVAVNVSARQFRHPDFVAQVLDIVAQTGADPSRLKLELTESLVVTSVEDIIVKMKALKAAGIGFSLDDFGTGYSSLAYLKRMPLDQLKIDQTFVRDVLTDPNDAVIATTIISLAHSLGLGVIAEGVETEAQREFLLANGCSDYQGYLYSKPMPLEALEDFVAANG